MESTTKILKQAGVFNAVLILIGMGYAIARLFGNVNGYMIADVALQLLAFAFALKYAFQGYKKDEAKSFKAFLWVTALSLAVTIVDILMSGKPPITMAVFPGIRLICVLLLALIKDLGKTKSYLLAGICFLSSVAGFIRQLIAAVSLSQALFKSLSGFVLSSVLFVFVLAKYIEKESRGTK